MCTIDMRLDDFVVSAPISFDELLSKGFASLDHEAIKVDFPGRWRGEYEIVVDQLSRHGYHVVEWTVEKCANGRHASSVFAKETYTSVREQALENQISVLEKEFGVVICYKKK